MDEADRAQEMTEVYEDAAMQSLAKRRAGCDYTRPPRITCRTCVDCGHILPRARLKAHPAAIRCIKCQSIFETGGTT
jgi:phage/conjugal plasmid C-4 type zinc finger TraR family protein